MVDKDVDGGPLFTEVLPLVSLCTDALAAGQT